jgi:AmmeMemoRadiSam system protein B
MSNPRSSVRQPAVAGTFYPGSAGELSAEVQRYLGQAETEPGPAPKALIAPHAGYVYSGPVAASAYALLRAHREQYSRVVLLGPSHRLPVRNLAVSGADAFSTPLGDVPLDQRAIATLDMPEVVISEDAHRFEHSLEVHLPFLQCVLGAFKLVPLVVGDATPETVARVLGMLWGGAETLVVASSDLSHYLPYGEARESDRITSEAIERLDGSGIGYEDACGATPVKGLLLEARRRGLRVATLDVRNSGDTAGSRDRVVGYGAWSFTEIGLGVQTH